MSRFARERRVFFLEEPVFEESQPQLRSVVCPESGVNVITPVLPIGLNQQEVTQYQKTFLSSLLAENAISNYIAWYYTPMALEFSSVLRPSVTVYDCMDELSAFAGAPPAMRNNEAALFQKADLVFTGGASLYESKRKQHSAVHLFPSSVDVKHFSRARAINQQMHDQVEVARPRLGYAGVIDERMDLKLISEVAAARPDWQFIMLGPVVKVDPALLPKAPNIHYLGMKPYAELPAYFAGWDIGILPFAANESTRFISPTKTPEYLAAGLHVVSSPIRDVITPYGDLGLVQIADGPAEFIKAVELLLRNPVTSDFRVRVDQFLSQSSWDKTWNDMNQLIEAKLAFNHLPSSGGAQAAGSVNSGAKGMSHV